MAGISTRNIEMQMKLEGEASPVPSGQSIKECRFVRFRSNKVVL